jgi:hypothetical protein
MRWADETTARRVATAALFAVAIVLALNTIYVVSRRSTVPLALDDTVLKKTIVREHDPGADDVHLLKLSRRSWMHVDRSVYEAVQIGQHLRKEAWSRQLVHGDQTLVLPRSPDFDAMLWLWPIALLATFWLGWRAWRKAVPSGGNRTQVEAG